MSLYGQSGPTPLTIMLMQLPVTVAGSSVMPIVATFNAVRDAEKLKNDYFGASSGQQTGTARPSLPGQLQKQKLRPHRIWRDICDRLFVDLSIYPVPLERKAMPCYHCVLLELGAVQLD